MRDAKVAMKARCLIALAAIAISQSALAVSGSWNVDASGNWSEAAKWTPGIPDGAGETANAISQVCGQSP
jgi:hypothetical protein